MFVLCKIKKEHNEKNRSMIISVFLICPEKNYVFVIRHFLQ